MERARHPVCWVDSRDVAPLAGEGLWRDIEEMMSATEKESSEPGPTRCAPCSTAFVAQRGVAAAETHGLSDRATASFAV